MRAETTGFKTISGRYREHKIPGETGNRTGAKGRRYNETPMAESGEVCVYQFKVVLRGVSPMIWRRILLRSDQTVADLHYTIQIAMGWSDSHLNRFHIHGKDYGVAS